MASFFRFSILTVILLVPYYVLQANAEDINPEISYATYNKTNVFCIKISHQKLNNINPDLIEIHSIDNKTFALSILGKSAAENQEKRDEYYNQLNAINTQISKLDEEIAILQSKLNSIRILTKEVGLKKTVLAYLQVQILKIENNLKEKNLKRDSIIKQQAEISNRYYAKQPTDTPENEQFINIFGKFREVEATEIVLRKIPQNKENILDIAKISLAPPSILPTNEKLVKEWAEAWINSLSIDVVNGGDARFQLYEIQKLSTLFQIPIPKLIESSLRQASDNIDPFSITTGGLAIQESLQLNRNINVEKNTLSSSSLSIDQLKGPDIKSHPFDEMLKGRTPTLFDIARMVPFDQYYAHFSSIKNEIELSDLLDQWGTNLLQSIEVSSHDRKVKERILNQLGLELSGLTRLFGDLVVGDIAITGNDPFITDGNDITVIFQIKNPTIFEQSIALHQAKLTKQKSNIEYSTTQYGEFKINSLKTSDREVSSYWTIIDSYYVYSNSLNAIRRIIDTSLKKFTSLKESSDFRYMRTIFPGTAEAEDGFLYLSDAFIRKVVGPEQKIGRFRQLQCIANLKTIENARLHQIVEKGKELEISITELLTNKLISEKEQICPSGGKYSLSKDGIATCSLHGSFRYLTPLVEIPTKKVTSEEAAGYTNFVTQYNQYWSRFFDPIGIRFKLKDKIEVETCILPLIENSIYNNIQNTVGGEPAKISLLRSQKTIATVGLKVFLKTFLEHNNKEHSHSGWTKAEEEAFINNLGESSTFNVYDGAPLFTIEGSSVGNLIGSRMFSRGEGFVISSMLLAATLPTYLTLDIKNVEQARADFNRLIHDVFVETRKANDRTINIDYYSLSSYKGFDIFTIKSTLFLFNMRFYTTFIGNKFVIATQRQVLTDLIDNASLEEKNTANLFFELNPMAFNQVSTTTATHWQEQMRNACFENFAASKFLLKYANINQEELSRESLKRLGYIPTCPSNGSYIFNKEVGQLSCSVHGTFMNPCQPYQDNGQDSFIKFIQSIRNINVSLKFIPEGVTTKLVINRGR